MGKQGGTQMYCVECKGIAVCAGVSPAQVTNDTDDYTQRMYFSQYSDIQFFQRGRICQTCGNSWVSAEVPLTFLEELTELRDALSEIKVNAEAYVKESSAASKSLAKLSESLQVMRALKLYKLA